VNEFISENPAHQKSIFEMFFTDIELFQRQYLKVVIKIVQIYEELKIKAEILKPIVAKIFCNEASKKYIDSEKIILGFFYMFIYKDFVLREIVYKFKSISNTDSK